MSSPVPAILWDLDGVVWHWPIDAEARIEASCSLPPRTIHRVAWQHDLIRDVCVGRLSHEAWLELTEARLTEIFGLRGATAAGAWKELRPVVDVDVRSIILALVGRTQLGVLTNTIRPVELDLIAAGLVGVFDLVIHSQTLGVAKPDRRVFQAASDALAVPSESVLVIDDSLVNVDAARVYGFQAIAFDNREQINRAIEIFLDPLT